MTDDVLKVKVQGLRENFNSYSALHHVVSDFQNYDNKPDSVSEEVYSSWVALSKSNRPIPIIEQSPGALGHPDTIVYDINLACTLWHNKLWLSSYLFGFAEGIEYIQCQLRFYDEEIQTNTQKDYGRLANWLYNDREIILDGREYLGSKFVKKYNLAKGTMDTLRWLGYFTVLAQECEEYFNKYGEGKLQSSMTSVNNEILMETKSDAQEILENEYFTELNLSEIALLNIYLKVIINDQNAKFILSNTNHTSEQKLKEYYKYYRNQSNRITPPKPGKKSYNTLKTKLEKVIARLKTIDNQLGKESAEKDLNELLKKDPY